MKALGVLMVALSALLAIGLATVGPSVLSADAMFALVAVLAGIGIVLAFAMSVALLADDEAPDRSTDHPEGEAAG
jgi:hypothetical protein